MIFDETPSGYTSFECIVALLLVGFISCSLALGLRPVLHLWSTTRTAYEERQNELLLFSLLLSMSRQIDQHRLPVFPVTHQNGNVAYRDGTANPITESRLRPSQGSSAITYFRSSALLPLSVAYHSPTELVLCHKTSTEQPDLSQVSGLLLLGTDGLLEAVILQPLPPQKTGCFSTRYSVPAHSMIVVQNETIVPMLALLIDQIYTLYVDESGQLRYLGHSGDRNNENQPIALNFGSLSLSTYNLPEQQELSLFGIQALIESPAGTSKNFSLVNHLARGHIWNYLFHFNAAH